MTVELEQLGERIAEQAAYFDAAMHRLLADVREFDERGGWQAQGARSCAHWLAWRVGWDLVTARERVRVARKLAEFSAIDDALRRGEVSYSKVRAMLRIATPANELLLLEHARLMTASQLETLCRKYAVVQRHGQDPHPLDDEPRRYVRRRDTDDGMVKIEAVLHPEEAELVWAMLTHAATQLTREPAPICGQRFRGIAGGGTGVRSDGCRGGERCVRVRSDDCPSPLRFPSLAGRRFRGIRGAIHSAQHRRDHRNHRDRPDRSRRSLLDRRFRGITGVILSARHHRDQRDHRDRPD